MDMLVILLTLVCYGVAVFLWWEQQMPIFLFALVSGHIGALASPLWVALYDFIYRSGMGVAFSILGEPVPTAVFFASAWFYTLPALLTLYFYYCHWWVPGYFAGLVAYGLFLFYHTIFESLGLRFDIWSYTSTIDLPFGLSNALISTLMAALISLVLLYVLLLVRRFSYISLLLVLLPATLLASLLIHGLLGAPLWITLQMNVQSWVVTIGALSTLILLAWAVHIVARGLGRIEWEMA